MPPKPSNEGFFSFREPVRTWARQLLIADRRVLAPPRRSAMSVIQHRPPGAPDDVPADDPPLPGNPPPDDPRPDPRHLPGDPGGPDVTPPAPNPRAPGTIDLA